MPFWGGAIAYQGALKEPCSPTGRATPTRTRSSSGSGARPRERPGADLLQKMTYLELKNRLAELLLMRVDKMTMATSVEARVPFLDQDLVEFALALPPEMKVRDGEGKYLLKQAVSACCPHEIVDRKKQGFGAPVSEWFRGELGERAQREIRESSLAERGLLDYDAIDRLWAAHRAGRGDWAFQLWNVYNVSAWHDLWVAGRALAPLWSACARALSRWRRRAGPRRGRRPSGGERAWRWASPARRAAAAATVGPGRAGGRARRHRSGRGPPRARCSPRCRPWRASSKSWSGSRRRARAGRRDLRAPLRPARLRPDRARAEIDWHADFKTGRRWPLRHASLLPVAYGDGSDIKVPWELSRFQHLPLLAAA